MILERYESSKFKIKFLGNKKIFPYFLLYVLDNAGSKKYAAFTNPNIITVYSETFDMEWTKRRRRRIFNNKKITSSQATLGPKTTAITNPNVNREYCESFDIE